MISVSHTRFALFDRAPCGRVDCDIEMYLLPRLESFRNKQKMEYFTPSFYIYLQPCSFTSGAAAGFAFLTRSLKRMGFRAEGLHGDMDQSRRDSIMLRFRTKTLSVLVATDIAARGLDISGVDLVFNYDVPKNAEHYVHRIGRTGRAGNVGRAITLVLGKEAKQMKRIQHHTKVEMGKETSKETVQPATPQPEVNATPAANTRPANRRRRVRKAKPAAAPEVKEQG